MAVTRPDVSAGTTETGSRDPLSSHHSRGEEAALGHYSTGIVRFRYWSNSGTVNAVSPWAGL